MWHRVIAIGPNCDWMYLCTESPANGRVAFNVANYTRPEWQGGLPPIYHLHGFRPLSTTMLVFAGLSHLSDEDVG
jgi:hypothetical protein